jgi:hypothetical protein
MARFASLWSTLQDAATPAPYLLVDCAGLAAGRAEIPREIFSQVECLFTGELAQELADVGPYLGRLRSFEAGVVNTVEELLLRHVASVAIVLPRAGAEPTFSEVHRHFRKLNVVYGPSGQPLFFRYYDPRVVVEVLSVFEPAQLDAFFGPVDALLLADAEGRVLRCMRQGGELKVVPAQAGAQLERS